MDIFSQVSLLDGGFFFLLGAGSISLIVFRRACQIRLSCPKDIKIKDYWGHYENEDEEGPASHEIRTISKIMKTNPTGTTVDWEVPAAYTAIHR
jgi:hypothetical protein